VNPLLLGMMVGAFAGFVAGGITMAILAAAARADSMGPSHTYARKHGGYQPECDVIDPKNPPHGKRPSYRPRHSK
jgi:hypothetical protein